MKRFLPLLFAFLMLMRPAGAINVWEKLDQNQTYLFMYIRGDSFLKRGIPPWDPLNDSEIEYAVINLPYNETHYGEFHYEGGRWVADITYFVPKSHWTPKVPFNLSDWNLSEVIKQYQWGVENYLPNVTGKYWPKGYWNSTITRWEVELNATTFKVTLYGGHCGECEQYITFQCWRNGTNVTCQWGKPIFKEITPPWTSRNTTTSTTREENKICGSAVLIGLVLVPLLIKRVKR